jgi:hypothetical protein
MKIINLFLVFSLAFILVGCGYTNPYNGDMPGLADDQRSEAVPIYVTMWKNNTSELGFQSLIYQELIKWLKKSKMVTLVQDRQQAEYILDGAIRSIRFEGLSYDENDNAIELRVVSKLSYELRERATNEIVWQQPGLIRRDNFIVGNDSIITSDSRRKALTSIARDIAQVIYTKIFYTISKLDK